MPANDTTHMTKEEFYAPCEPYPKGAWVKVKPRDGGPVFEGEVLFYWACLDTPGINVRTPGGAQMSALPEMGDEIEIVRMPQ